MAIHEWPADDRPREKLLAAGAHTLSDAELLAVLLGSGTRGNSAVQIGRNLIKKFGSLRRLLCAEREDCLRQPGVGMARYCVLQAALELTRRHYGDGVDPGPLLDQPARTLEFLRAKLRDLRHEVFGCLHLDNRHRMLAFDEVARGTIDGAHVHLRDVIRQALFHNSAAVILAHNHPSGATEPSHADEIVTQRLREALILLDIRVLDHIIVGEKCCFSFAEHGLL